MKEIGAAGRGIAAQWATMTCGVDFRRWRSPTRAPLHLSIALVLLIVVAGCAGEPSVDERYMSALEDSGLSEVFVGEAKALDNASELCNAINSGEQAQGSEADKIGVEYFCNEHLQGFKVLSEENYLQALEEAGLANEFVAGRQAIMNAESVCDTIDNGGRAQGSEADKIGVEYYCHEYADAFEVLRVVDVSGSFTLFDAGDYGGLSDGASCEGEGGYGDINRSTAVVLLDTNGAQLARTTLGNGQVAGFSCVFEFTLSDVSEGVDNDSYLLSVGNRGEMEYSFLDLWLFGPDLSMGG